jgi:hypothetical protein
MLSKEVHEKGQADLKKGFSKIRIKIRGANGQSNVILPFTPVLDRFNQRTVLLKFKSGLRLQHRGNSVQNAEEILLILNTVADNTGFSAAGQCYTDLRIAPNGDGVIAVRTQMPIKGNLTSVRIIGES